MKKKIRMKPYKDETINTTKFSAAANHLVHLVKCKLYTSTDTDTCQSVCTSLCKKYSNFMNTTSGMVTNISLPEVADMVAVTLDSEVNSCIFQRLALV